MTVKKAKIFSVLHRSQINKQISSLVLICKVSSKLLVQTRTFLVGFITNKYCSKNDLYSNFLYVFLVFLHIFRVFIFSSLCTRIWFNVLSPRYQLRLLQSERKSQLENTVNNFYLIFTWGLSITLKSLNK